jgi:tricorn protease
MTQPRRSSVFLFFTQFLLCLLLGSSSVHAQDPADEARLLRFPAIHGQNIVFSYAGNLYTVAAEGGVARRLTSHDGYEMFARFSPDGKRLAFTGQYDGNTEVYVMPAEGGVPRRLTFTATLNRDEISDRMGPNNIVMTWKNNDEIVFRSRMREWNDFIGQLYTVRASGGLPQQLPLPRGGFCSFSADGKKLAYNRVFREFRTWKRYRGGMADDIWIHDFATKKTENIATDPACDVFPMWSGDKIYFLSDRDKAKRFNLYVHDTGSGALRQLTRFTDYDIKYPSLGDKAIVFEYAGRIHRFDLATEQAQQVPIRVLEDFAGGRSGMRDVSKNIADGDISPDGKRALFSARGDIFTVPAKEGATRNLSATSGAHERDPAWSPDGKTIAYISDASGDDEIHVSAQDGTGTSRQLTRGGGPYKYAVRWSPDSKKLAWSDKKLRLFYVDVDSAQVKLVDQAKAWEIRDYTWSPDSKWLAYARPEEETFEKVMLYSVADDKKTEITDGTYESRRPEFSSDGKFLFFVSERDFDPIYSATEWNHAYADMARIYLVTLAKETPSPFKSKGDEVGSRDKDEAGDKDKDKEKKKKETPPVRVDLDGIAGRVLQVPATVGNYSGLRSVGDKLFYFRSSRKGSSLYLFDLGDKKETDLGKVDAYEISADRKKMLVNKGGSWGIIDLPKGTISISDALDLSGLQVQLDRRQEWRQIFHESWRHMRDYFYDPNLHGVDWPGLRGRYEPLLAHVNHRADLTYIIGEMISELGAGHAYVGGGDLPKLTRIKTGLLGAELQQDQQTKYYRIARILPGSTRNKELRSPLAELGVDVRTGDYIIAVDGRPTNEMGNIYEALVGKADKQVKLKINSEPKEMGSREVLVVPIADEQPLYYQHMVDTNTKTVNDATKGKVGYVHIPDMQAHGLNEFAKQYYHQLRKKALIVDVRGNGGGNVSPMIIERLRREIAMIDMSRDTAPRPDPGEILYGPKVCLMNEFSASDGDIFPYRFRHYKLGKLIGKRSWGGTIGIRGTLPFVDGGSLNKPEFASYALDGKSWLIEGHGVDPDIVVDNDPAREYAGRDDQLERAIAVILDELRTGERTLPPPPPFPKR